LISTSCEEVASEVLAACIAGRPPKRLPSALLQEPCARALFSVLVEGLADRFDPALCTIYARLLSTALPGADLGRYERIRRVRPVNTKPRRVYVLSRITLGADIAVTSVLMNAARIRFPKAQIVFVGPRKNFELFASDPRFVHAPVDYRRGSIGDRASAAAELRAIIDDLVLDPDSRLTQLGLLPVGDESRYHLFESRSYGADTSLSLPQLASQWCEETLGVPGSMFRVPATEPFAGTAVSLGVGENMAKRLPDPFELELIRLLAARSPVIIDRGGSPEESARVERAAQGTSATLFEGSFAEFGRVIAGSSLYVGYDSAGQHVAAAAKVRLISIFAGFPAPRMFDRWRPVGPHATVIRVDNPDPMHVLEQIKAAL
jgi:Glycosyltransferase family 9 (heptosyltransferase)